MASTSTGPQTATYTSTVNGGATGDLAGLTTAGTSGLFGTGTSARTTGDENLIWIQDSNSGATIDILDVKQKTGQKCLLQIDIVENDAGGYGITTNPATLGLDEIPELVRRLAAACDHTEAETNQAAANLRSGIKSVYVRIEYGADISEAPTSA